jgi:hypothetical protein
MVTGIETAGLVLAILPLFISALEHYKEGLEPIKIFLDYDNQLPMQIHRLSCQHVQYELTLRILLSEIAEGDDLAEMITNPFGASWKAAAIQRKLKSRLRESYDAYERTVQHMEGLLKGLAKRMSIDHNKTVRIKGPFDCKKWRPGSCIFRRTWKTSSLDTQNAMVNSNLRNGSSSVCQKEE